MAATGVEFSWKRRALTLLAAAFLATVTLHADTEAELRSEIRSIATALSAGNAAEALASFSRKYPQYDLLQDYFQGLTSSFSIRSEVDMLEEEDTDTNAKATLRWAITLSDPQTSLSENRSGEIAAQFERIKGKWKIVGLKPLDIFNPAVRAKTR